MKLGDSHKNAVLDRDGVTVKVEDNPPHFYPWGDGTRALKIAQAAGETADAAQAAADAAQETADAAGDTANNAASMAEEALAELDNCLKKTLPDGEYRQDLTGALRGFATNERQELMWQLGRNANDTKRYVMLDGTSGKDGEPMYAQMAIAQTAGNHAISKSQVAFNYNGSDQENAIIAELSATKTGARVSLTNNQTKKRLVMSDNLDMILTKEVDGVVQEKYIDLWELAR